MKYCYYTRQFRVTKYYVRLLCHTFSLASNDEIGIPSNYILLARCGNGRSWNHHIICQYKIKCGALPEGCRERLYRISKAACLGTEARYAHGRCVCRLICLCTAHCAAQQKTDPT